MAGGDIQRGAISGWEAYLTTAFVGTTISLVTGAMGNVLHGSGLVANVLGGFASGFLSSAAGQYVDIVQKGTGEIDWGQAIKSGLFSSAIQAGSWMLRNADKVKDAVKGLTGKAAGGSRKLYSDYAKNATQNPASSEVVIGKYYQDGVSYVKVAENRNATYFQLDNWDDVVASVGEDNIWNINEEFLQQQMSSGKIFITSHNPYEATGFFALEVNFLQSKGYGFIQEGAIWKAINKFGG